MQCKILSIHLSDERRAIDEAKANEFLKNANVKRVFASTMGKDSPLWSILLFYEAAAEEGEIRAEEDIELSPQEETAYELLRRWRNKRAAEEQVKPFKIAHNIWLKQMVKLPVKTVDDFMKVKGFGAKRAELYGKEILAALKQILTNQ